MRIVDGKDLDIQSNFMGHVRISPETARSWLSINTGNRRQRKALIEYLVRQILNQEWQEDHPQPIVFSKMPRLIDGQHRLEAIAVSGMTVVASVLCGARDELRQYLDTGVTRNLEDRVAFSQDLGVNQKVGMIINCIWNCSRNRVTRPSPEEAMEVFRMNPDGIIHSATIMNVKKQRAVTRAPAMSSLAEMYRRDSRLATAFGESLLQVDGPVQQSRVLRDWLLSRGSASGGQVEMYEAFAKSTYAMQASLEGREIKACRSGRWDSFAVPSVIENERLIRSKIATSAKSALPKPVLQMA